MERTIAERERRLAIARAASTIEIALGILALAVAAFGMTLFLDPPCYCPMFDDLPRDPWPLSRTIIGLGAIGIVTGFAWMWHIRYTGPEDGAPSNWRSH